MKTSNQLMRKVKSGEWQAQGRRLAKLKGRSEKFVQECNASCVGRSDS